MWLSIYAVSAVIVIVAIWWSMRDDNLIITRGQVLMAIGFVVVPVVNTIIASLIFFSLIIHAYELWMDTYPLDGICKWLDTPIRRNK